MVLRLLVLLVALALAGCGGNNGETDTTTGAAAPSSCVPATTDILTPVGNKLTLEGGRVGNGQLVESTETPGIWFLSAELDGPGLEEEGDIATWATTSQFGSEAIYAVDELAKEHSSWREVAEADGISAADAAADESRACVES